MSEFHKGDAPRTGDTVQVSMAGEWIEDERGRAIYDPISGWRFSVPNEATVEVLERAGDQQPTELTEADRQRVADLLVTGQVPTAIGFVAERLRCDSLQAWLEIAFMPELRIGINHHFRTMRDVHLPEVSS